MISYWGEDVKKVITWSSIKKVNEIVEKLKCRIPKILHLTDTAGMRLRKIIDKRLLSEKI